jgi:DNA-binding response OmpR family regulator
MKILITQDNKNITKEHLDTLKKQEYCVTLCSKSDDVFDIIDDHYFDLYIIAVQLEHTSIEDVLDYIKSKDTHTPIILLFDTNSTLQNKRLLKYKCDDALFLPFCFKQLQYRIEAIFLKQHQKVVHIEKNIYYDMLLQELFVNNECVRLRKKEQRLLTLLLQNINSNVSLETIYNYVWEGEIKSRYPLRQLVSDVRKLLKTKKNHIIPITGNGYKFELL